MIDFKNTKIRILSPEHSETFQQAVFEAGGKWASGGCLVDHVDQPYLFVDSDMELSWAWDDLYYISKDWKEITFPCPSTKEGHPHAELMAQYAEDAKTNAEPWRIWQHYSLGPFGEDWFECQHHPDWCEITEYRRKPKVKIIHGVEVPDISFVPKVGEHYYYPNPLTPRYFSSTTFAVVCDGDNHRVSHGLCYPVTEEGKQASILHAKAMIDVINSGEDE